MSEPTRKTIQLALTGTTLLLAATSAVAQTLKTDSLQEVHCVKLAPGAKPQSIGCTILAQRTVRTLLPGPLFWYLSAFPTRAAAEAAGGPTSVVVTAEGRNWVFSVAPDNGGPRRGESVAQVGPLALPGAGAYTIEAAVAVLPPGSHSAVHTHAGPEAWYLLAGEQCLETPTGAHRAGVGQSMMVPGYTPMQLVVTGHELRRSLVLVVHDASTGFATPSDWKPAGRCSTPPSHQAH